MENSLSSIKGQALFEFCIVIIILIPLCVVGLKFLGQSGEKRLNDEKNRFLKEKTKNPQFEEDIVGEMGESGESSIHLTPSGFEFNGKKIDFIEDTGATNEALNTLRSDLKEQGWKEVQENGIFIFLREDERKYAWKMDGGIALLAD